MNRIESIEQRLERINHAGNLRLEYLKRVYDPRPILEHDRADETRIHMHGLWHSPARWKHIKSIEICGLYRWNWLMEQLRR